MKIQFCTSQTKHFFNRLKNNCNYFFSLLTALVAVSTLFLKSKLNMDISYPLGDTGFFRLQGIKVLWRLQFLGYLRTLSLKFQKARTKIQVVLTLPGWLSQFLKVLKYSRNCRLHNTLIPNLVKPLTYIVVNFGSL